MSVPQSTPLADPFFLDDENLYPDVSDGGHHPETKSANPWVWSLGSKYASRGYIEPPPPTGFSPPSADRSHRGSKSPPKKASAPPPPPAAGRPLSGHPEQHILRPMASARHMVGNKEMLISGRHSVATGEALSSAVVGAASSFDVHGCDRASRPVLVVGLLSSVLVVQIVGPTVVEHKLEPLADGSVRVWYTPGVSGRYALRLAVRMHAGSTRIDAGLLWQSKAPMNAA